MTFFSFINHNSKLPRKVLKRPVCLLAFLQLEAARGLLTRAASQPNLCIRLREIIRKAGKTLSARGCVICEPFLPRGSYRPRSQIASRGASSLHSGSLNGCTLEMQLIFSHTSPRYETIQRTVKNFERKWAGERSRWPCYRQYRTHPGPPSPTLHAISTTSPQTPWGGGDA